MTPSALPTAHILTSRGFDQSWFEWRPELRGKGPTLLFVHATGFHARLWDEIISHLPGCHVIAVDQRGHGRSEGGKVDNWREFGEDLAHLVEALDLTNIVGIGHSMGGHTLVDAVARCQDRFRRIIIIDPVVPELAAYEYEKDTGFSPDNPHPAAKRKNHFESADEMIARFEDRSPYVVFTATTLRNYCVYGLLPNPDGDGLVLACPPAVESNVYMTSRTNAAIYESIATIDIPVLVIRAKRNEGAKWDFTSSPTSPALASEFKNGRDMYRPDLTHFMPFEVPDEIAGIIEEEAQAGQEG